ncbi:MAG TPA: hypothetical protein VGB67_04450 [Fibrella sp.]
MNPLTLPDNLRDIAKKHFVLLESENIAKKRDTLSLRLSGYSDVTHLIGDIVKVCILAMGDGSPYSSAHIPEPESNISGVLSIILDLLPYEESDLLDMIRQEVLNPSPEPDEDWDFILASVSITMPSSFEES